MANQNLCLVSTVHDPAGKLAPFILASMPVLETIYGKIRVNVTQKTHLATWTALGEYGRFGDTSGNGAEGRRGALRLGLETDCDVFHYCDFDRILYWVSHHAHELIECTKDLSEKSPFIIYERSRPALYTHPFFQRITERLANAVYEDLYRDNYTLDYLSGARIIPRVYVCEILARSTTNNAAALDFEWPLILGRDRLTHLTVNGLAYEHRFLGIQKPFFEEIKTRLVNLFEVIKLRYVTW